MGASNPSTTVVDTPEAINLDFQTGIAADTLLFGGIRWVDWSSFEIAPADYGTITTRPILSYVNDTITYRLGVGRQLNENWSVSAALTYEKHQDEFFTNLGPKDGLLGLTLGARYRMDNMVISGGINYTDIGNAKTVVSPTGPVLSDFSDNSAIGAGIKIGYYF